jgi:hypothetical protein
VELDRIDEVLLIPESAGNIVLQWLVSASTCICANPIVKFTVHLLQTASPTDNRIVFGREEVRGRKPRHSLHRVALGLGTKAESSIKSMRYRTTRKSEPLRVGRDWPAMSATLALPDYRRVARQPVTTGGRLTVPSAACTLWGRIGTFENEPARWRSIESVSPSPAAIDCQSSVKA